MAPFELALVPIGAGKNAAVRTAAESLYRDLSAAGIDVLLDDRDERPGVAFADMELIGIPHRVVVGERGLKAGQVEYQGRRDSKAQPFPLQDAVKSLKSMVCAD
jgi:prolyl-tRNA synthetase